VGFFSWRKKKGPGEPGEGEEMSFFSHLEELRWHLIRCVFAVMIFGTFLFIYRLEIMSFIYSWPFDKDFPTYAYLCKLSSSLCVETIPVERIATKPFEQFSMSFVYSLVGGLIMAFPYIIWELWKFIRPALSDREITGVKGNVFWISLLFLVGIFFGFFIILPFSIQFLSTFQAMEGIKNMWRFGDVVNFVTLLVLGTGALFEFPVAMYYLGKLGIISSSFLRRYRKHSVVIIFIIAGIVTPPDPFSQTVLAIPMYLLFEISIFLLKRVERGKEKKKQIEDMKYGTS
jgi:sec-independent protein translocase protein TatC